MLRLERPEVAEQQPFQKFYKETVILKSVIVKVSAVKIRQFLGGAALLHGYYTITMGQSQLCH